MAGRWPTTLQPQGAESRERTPRCQENIVGGVSEDHVLLLARLNGFLEVTPTRRARAHQRDHMSGHLNPTKVH